MSYIVTEKNIIISSESIILDDPDTSVIVPIEYDGQEQGKIMIKFIDSDEVPDGGFRNTIENNMLVLECINFNKPLGQFTLEPINIGALDGRKLSMHLWSSLNGNEKRVRRLQYSIFLEKI